MLKSTSKERLSIMHYVLDKEIEMITAVNNRNGIARKSVDNVYGKAMLHSNDSRDSYKYKIDFANRSVLDAANEDISRSRKKYISQLEKKLQELERKMENLSSSSNDSLTEKINEQLQGSVQKKSTKGTNLQVTPNFTSNNSYKIDKIIHNEPNEEYEYESFDYKKWQKQFDNKRDKLDLSMREQPYKYKSCEKKITVYNDLLLPKYRMRNNSSDKIANKENNSLKNSSNRRRGSNRKNSIRRNSSKNSVKSIDQLYKNSKNTFKSQYFYRYSEKYSRINPREGGNYKNYRKIANLEKEIAWYKKLTAKLQTKIMSLRVMEIYHKQLKNNFAKSYQIRLQQKKIIENLKNKVK